MKFLSPLGQFELSIVYTPVLLLGIKRQELSVKHSLEVSFNNFTVKVGLCASTPLGVDTEEDLKKITKEMN